MKQKIYIILFAILYIIVAFSSFFHSVEFFALSNQLWMGVILALAFEIGQAAVLLSILTTEERKKFISWLLMGILTLVQIIGNVYSSYKFILTNSVDNLQYFKEPIFVWTDLPDNQTTVIVTYISSAILPLCALLLTAMVSNFLEKKQNTVEYEYEEEPAEETEEITEETPQEEPSQEEELILEDETSEDENNEVSENVISEPVDESENERQENYKEESESSPEVKLDTVMEVSEDDRKPEVKGQSHFVHI